MMMLLVYFSHLRLMVHKEVRSFSERYKKKKGMGKKVRVWKCMWDPSSWFIAVREVLDLAEHARKSAMVRSPVLAYGTRIGFFLDPYKKKAMELFNMYSSGVESMCPSSNLSGLKIKFKLMLNVY